jgi:drug/metabolite transporter (DMT)-like permease
LLIKLINWNPIAISGMRSAMAALLMLIIIKKPSMKFSKNKIFGAIAYAATVVFFVMANKMTTAANAIILQYTAPIYIALFGNWFLNEKAELEDWISIFFILGGMVLFFMDNISAGGISGNIFGILSGIAFAFVAIFMRKQKNDSPLESLFWGNLLAAIIGIPFMFTSMPDTKSWIGLGLLGIFQLGLSYVLYSIAIKHITALEAVLIPVIEPVLNPLWVFLFIGEKPGKWALIGGAVVLISVTVKALYSVLKSKVPEKYDLTTDN